MQTSQLTRRDFLKLSSLGLFSLMLPVPDWILPQKSVENIGRILDVTVPVYAIPSFSGKITRRYWRDLIIPIHEATVGDGEPKYNRVWYHTDDGYVHSGKVQPVQVLLNSPVQSIPKTGQLAEVTVPFTDTHRKAGLDEKVVYRLYYGTTHWVTSSVQAASGDRWYEIYDEHLKGSYYAVAEHLRLVPVEELLPLSSQVPPEEKLLEVRLQEQVVVAYETGRAVFMSPAATGARFSTGNYTTPTGRFIIQRKSPSSHMASRNLAGPDGYDLPGVPWVSYFTEEGISFHGTFWHNDFGQPRSHGCINLPSPAAKWVYRWSLPIVPPDQSVLFEKTGTAIEIH